MMEHEVSYTIGATITADDGPCGTLARVVIDPIGKVVTHVVVTSPHHHGAPRLVPVSLLSSAGEARDRFRLHGSVADFFRLAIVEETHFMPPPPGFAEYDEALFWPYFVGEDSPPSMAGMVTEEYLPAREVDIRRGDPVHATDGDIGQVKGLVVTPSDHTVTHVLLLEGHLFGRKEVSIPVSAITRMEDGVELNLSRQQVRDLPAVIHDASGPAATQPPSAANR